MDLGDLGLQDQMIQPDEGFTWNRDYGPDPDIDPTACTDLGPPPSFADAAPSLAVTPEVKWKCPVPKVNSGSNVSVLVGAKGELVVWSSRTGLHALDEKCNELWNVTLPPGVQGITPPLRAGTSYVFGSWQGTVHLYDPTAGGLWSWSFPGPFDPTAYGMTTGPPALASKSTFYVGVAHDYLHHKALVQGKTLWGASLFGSPVGSLVVGPDGTAYAALFPFRRVAAVSGKGWVLWTRTLHPDVAYVAGMALTGPRELIAGVYSGFGGAPPKADIVSIDPGCGAERWRTKLSMAVAGPLLIGPQGNIYCHTGADSKRKDTLYSLSPAGKLRWKQEIEDSIAPAPLKLRQIGPIGADGTVYVQIENGLGKYDTTYEPSQVRAYSSDGKLLWKLLIPGMNVDSGVFSQPVLLDDGTLVLAAWVETKTEQGAFLYGIQTKSPGMAKSAWPRALHDNANTSRLTPP